MNCRKRRKKKRAIESACLRYKQHFLKDQRQMPKLRCVDRRRCTVWVPRLAKYPVHCFASMTSQLPVRLQRYFFSGIIVFTQDAAGWVDMHQAKGRDRRIGARQRLGRAIEGERERHRGSIGQRTYAAMTFMTTIRAAAWSATLCWPSPCRELTVVSSHSSAGVTLTSF